MLKVFDSNAISHERFSFEWQKQFSESREEVKDDERSRRVVTAITKGIVHQIRLSEKIDVWTLGWSRTYWTNTEAVRKM